MPDLTAHDFKEAIPAIIADNEERFQGRNVDLVGENESIAVGSELRKWMVEHGVDPEIADFDHVTIEADNGITQQIEQEIAEAYANQDKSDQGISDTLNTDKPNDQAPTSLNSDEQRKHLDQSDIAVASLENTQILEDLVKKAPELNSAYVVGPEMVSQAETEQVVDASFTVETISDNNQTITGETVNEASTTCSVSA